MIDAYTWPAPFGSLLDGNGGSGFLHAEYGADEQRRVKRKPGGDRGEKSAGPEAEPVDGEQPAHGARDKAHGVRDHARDRLTDALHDEEESEAEAEAGVDGP